MMSCCISRSRKNHALSFSFLYLGARRPSPLNPVSLPSAHIKRRKVTTAGSSQDLSTWSRPGEAEIRPPGSVFNVDSGVLFFFTSLAAHFTPPISIFQHGLLNLYVVLSCNYFYMCVLNLRFWPLESQREKSDRDDPGNEGDHYFRDSWLSNVFQRVHYPSTSHSLA